jgi:nucleoside diphosphate kinase
MNAEDQQRTVLLCKPSSQNVHHIIVKELQSSGLFIERRLLNVTPEQALALVLRYPSLHGRVTTDHSAGKTNPLSAADVDGAVEKAAELPEYIKLAQRQRQRQQRGARQQRTGQPDHRLLASIQQLAQENWTHPATAAATAVTGAAAAQRRLSTSRRSNGVYDEWQRGCGVDTLPSQRLYSTFSSSTRNTVPRNTHPLPLAYRHAQPSFPTADAASRGLALDTVLDHPALEDEVVRQHVEHLIHDGTNLALLVRGPDAVERVAQLCGPESIDEARRTAPQSWTARFGVDAVRNAVYAPATLTDAQLAANMLFQLRHANRHMRSMKLQQQQQSSHTSLPEGPTETGGQHPITFAAILPALRAQVDAQHRLSYFTGVPSAITAPPTLAMGDAAQLSTTSPVGAAQGEASLEVMVQATTTATTTGVIPSHASAVHCVPATPYPERRERLDELDNLLRQRTVGC